MGSAGRADARSDAWSAAILNDWQLSGVLHRPGLAVTGLRPRRISYNEQRREREPDRLARLRRAGSSTSAIPAAAARATSTGSSTRRRSPGRPTAASASSRAATSWAAAPTRPSTCALARHPAWAAPASSSSASTCSTRSTPWSSTTVRTRLQFNSPTDLTIRNPQFLADGSVDPTRLQPTNAGFGAATGAQALRTSGSASVRVLSELLAPGADFVPDRTVSRATRASLHETAF